MWVKLTDKGTLKTNLNNPAPLCDWAIDKEIFYLWDIGLPDHNVTWSLFDDLFFILLKWLKTLKIHYATCLEIKKINLQLNESLFFFAYVKDESLVQGLLIERQLETYKRG